jgi:hypothetical protein
LAVYKACSTQNMKNYLHFLLLMGVTVFLTYFSSVTISSIWYVVLLFMYARSKNEAFWLVFFFATTDGFMGFFGLYSTILKIIPGLPGIEISQYYIIISLVKAIAKKNAPTVFYSRWLGVLMAYCIFLLIFGIANGLSNDKGNVYFKLVKLIMPLLMFYSVPKLMNKLSDYQELFRYLFLVTVLAFVAQIATMFTGFEPRLYFNPVAAEGLEGEIQVGRNFRVLNNPGITLISLFGALYFLSNNKISSFKNAYLYIIVLTCFGIAFLSATRGWILCFSFIIIMSLIFVLKTNVKHVFAFIAFFVVMLLAGMNNKTVSTQIQYSIDRLFTLNSIASGDVTAGGTLIRLNERGPMVMKVWKKSPVFGPGFSDQYFNASDMHVGNQNILMHAGVLGFALIFSFLIYFIIKMINQYLNLPPASPFYSACLLFILFLTGWIFLHSTSSQQFAFYGLPNDVFPQAIFFTMAALTINGFRIYKQVNAA